MNDDPLTVLARELGDACLAKSLRVAIAESCTGGGLGEAITRIGGSSQWFERGFITYTDEAKQQLLGVNGATLAAHGAVSEQVAREMVLGVLSASPAEAGASITGIAGPGGAMPGKPVGMVCFGWARREGVVVTETCRFDGDRGAVRQQAVRHALQGLLLMLR